MSWVEAPASIRSRTVATQSGRGLVTGLSPLPTTAQSSGELSQWVSRASMSAPRSIRSLAVLALPE
jgi:hypothetical protein